MEDPAVDDEVADHPLLLPNGPYWDPNTGLQAIGGGEDDDGDEDEDEDFVDDEDDSDEEEDDEDESIAEENNLQIAIRQEFDDADIEAEDDSDEELEPNPDPIVQLMDEFLANDKKMAKAAAAERKRKRAEDDEGDEARHEGFEGFSTPVRGSRDMFGFDLYESDDSDDSSGSESSFDSSVDSDHGSEAEFQKLAQARERALNLVGSPSESSSTSSDSSSEGEEMVRANEEDGTSSSGSDSSSASSDSDSEDSSDSSGSEMGRNVDGAKAANAIGLGSSSSTLPASAIITIKSRAVGSAPGEGTARTHRNNDRGKRRRRLLSLKKQGLLPEDADLKSLGEYEEGVSRDPTSSNFITIGTSEQQIKGGSPEAANQSQSMVVAEAVPANEATPMGDKITTPSASTSSLPHESSAHVDIQPADDPSPRRTKLDLASSRRMLFSALGVRTPKDKAAEDALREKLSKSNRQLKHLNSSNSPQSINKAKDDETILGNISSWEDKLTVTAVECERDGWKLPPPPFPFQQGWAKGNFGGKGRNKRHARDDRQYYNSSQNGAAYTEDISTLNYDDEASVGKPQQATSKQDESAASANDHIPVPTTFEGLPDLGRDQLLKGAIIAYMELQMDHSTNYQPVISTYKVGRIEEVESGDTVRLLLAQPFWIQPSAMYDENTGERILGKFAVSPDDAEDTPDDGIREVAFYDMITPKLIDAPLVEVPNSSLVPEPRVAHGQDASGSSNHSHLDVVPESADHAADSSIQLEQIEIATPRRDEITTIIKEAGFHSILDEQLLQPIQNPADVDGQIQTEDALAPEGLSESQGVVPHRFRHVSARIHQGPNQDTSSEIDVTGEVPASSQDNGNIFTSEPDQESSPYMPTQETVEYPHISQIEINSSEQVKDTNSSSHQDAQRISPAQLVDMSFTISDHEKGLSQVEDFGIDESVGEAGADPKQDYENRPLQSSEVPQSPSQEVEGEDDRSQPTPAQSVSFLGGRGYDGQDSSYQDDAYTDDDSDGLPSIRELTSSQQKRKSTRSSVVVEIPIKKSPQPGKVTSRSLKTERRSTPNTSPELLDSSGRPDIKISESQHLPRLSQVPAGSQFIDLTQSSSPMKEDEDYKAPSKAPVSGKNKTTSKVAKRASGIGNRKLLTKKRSYV